MNEDRYVALARQYVHAVNCTLATLEYLAMRKAGVSKGEIKRHVSILETQLKVCQGFPPETLLEHMYSRDLETRVKKLLDKVTEIKTKSLLPDYLSNDAAVSQVLNELVESCKS